MTSFEDDYIDILQSIETFVVEFYTAHPDLNDYQVDKVYEALIRLYKSQVVLFPPTGVRLTDVELELALNIKKITDWYILGMPLDGDSSEEEDIPEGVVSVDLPGTSELFEAQPVPAAEMVACFKRLRKSVKHWGKEGGRQGYLNYIKPFIFGATL